MNHTEQSALSSWKRWRAILDKIIASPHYRYDDPKKWPYLKTARFAQEQLGVFNTLRWQLHKQSCQFVFHGTSKGCTNSL